MRWLVSDAAFLKCTATSTAGVWLELQSDAAYGTQLPHAKALLAGRAAMSCSLLSGSWYHGSKGGSAYRPMLQQHCLFQHGLAAPLDAGLTLTEKNRLVDTLAQILLTKCCHKRLRAASVITQCVRIPHALKDMTFYHIENWKLC